MQNDDIHTIANKVLQLSKQDDSNVANKKLVQILNNTELKPVELNNLGLLFYKQIEYQFSRQVYEFALSKDPKNISVHNNLGLTLNRLGLSSKAVEHYRKALDINPHYHNARSNLAYTLLYFGKPGRKEILQAHKSIIKNAFPEKKEYIDTSKLLTRDNRKIRIGYVSSDLRNHAVGRFMQGILEKHNRTNFDIHVFDNRKDNVDSTAERLKSLQLTWHNIASLSSSEASKLIVENKIDILIDLSGHTNGGRPDIFCNRIAPLQLTYLGYPNTSGIPNMDFRIGDEYADLIKFSDQNTESMLRLPVAMWNYKPWSDMPQSPSACPFKKNGFITFGSANNHAKLQEPWLRTWAKVLIAVPKSKLFFKSRALKSPDIRNKVLSIFTEAGISKDRIILKHYSATKTQHWKELQEFDIALDSFPYNGTTTTCDLLNLGIPVVTMSGESHVSRTTGSILNTLNLNSWIASNEKQFIHTCIDKADNLLELEKLRQSLQLKFKSSSLGNSDFFIIEYEKALINTLKQFKN